MMTKDDYNKWSKIIENQRNSNLSQIKWCSKNNINVKTFGNWKKKILEVSSNTFALVTKPIEEKEASTTKIHIGSAVIEIDNFVNIEQLENIVKVLIKYV